MYVAYSEDKVYKDVGDTTQLFIDNDVIAVVKNVTRRQHTPKKHADNPLIRRDKPLGREHVLQDELLQRCARQGERPVSVLVPGLLRIRDHRQVQLQRADAARANLLRLFGRRP